jgi:hypothetical protein
VRRPKTGVARKSAQRKSAGIYGAASLDRAEVPSIIHCHSPASICSQHRSVIRQRVSIAAKKQQ